MIRSIPEFFSCENLFHDTQGPGVTVSFIHVLFRGKVGGGIFRQQFMGSPKLCPCSAFWSIETLLLLQGIGFKSLITVEVDGREREKTNPDLESF